jgi:PEP-CTERM motif
MRFCLRTLLIVLAVGILGWPPKPEALIATVGGLSWAPGQSLWLRWTDANDAGNDHGLAIDNVSVEASGAVPEPSTLTMFGVGALGLAGAVYRRRIVAA